MENFNFKITSDVTKKVKSQIKFKK